LQIPAQNSPNCPIASWALPLRTKDPFFPSEVSFSVETARCFEICTKETAGEKAGAALTRLPPICYTCFRHDVDVAGPVLLSHGVALAW
jgi:hypothetical protein